MTRITSSSRAREPAPLGVLLQYWRKARNLSQLALAHEARVSSRHVSFMETGRTKPSREMVLRLAETLTVPLRERNALLLAAGFAPVFRESTLDDPALLPVRAAMDAILGQQEPFPAVAMNRRWDIVANNSAAARFFALLLDGRMIDRNDRAPNVLRLMFHPDGLRPTVMNWSEVAQALLQRLHREAVGGVLDDATRQLLAEAQAYPGVPEAWSTPDLDRPLLPVLPVCFKLGTTNFNYFSAVTVLGTPQDVTLQELRIEAFFPSDEQTAKSARALVAM